MHVWSSWAVVAFQTSEKGNDQLLQILFPSRKEKPRTLKKFHGKTPVRAQRDFRRPAILGSRVAAACAVFVAVRAVCVVLLLPLRFDDL